MRKYLITIIAVLFLSLGIVHAQTIPGVEQWFYNIAGNYLYPTITGTKIRVPSLGSSGNPCVDIADTNGTFATTTCGSGGGSGVPSTTPFTSGYIPYATSTLALTNSNIFQLGSNVGIGTTEPAQKLDVNGNAQIFDQTAVTGATTLTVKAGAGQGNVNEFQVLANNGSNIFSVGNNMVSSAYDWNGSFFGNNYYLNANNWSLGSGVNIAWTNGGYSATKDINLSRGAAGKLYVGNGTAGDFTGTLIAGNVGIGTTTPSSKLQVNGSALLGVGNTTSGTLLFANSANLYTTTLQSSSTQASNLTFTLPPTSGSAGQVLSTDGAGVTSWVTSSGGLASYNVVSANGLITVSTSTNVATLTASTSPTFTNGAFTGTLSVTGVPTLSGVSDCNGSTYLQITSGLFGCGTPAGGGGSSQWTVGSGFIRNATSTDAVEIGNGSSTPIAGSLVLSSAGTTTPSFTLLHTNGSSAIEMRDGGIGKNNFFLGLNTGNSITTGINNTAIGTLAMNLATVDANNVAIGTSALQRAANSNVEYNVAIGGTTMSNSAFTGEYNVAIGYSDMANASGANNGNTFIGDYADGSGNGTNTNNLGAGFDSGKNLTSGSFDILLGSNAGENQTTASNIFMVDNGGDTTFGRASASNEWLYSILYGNMASADSTTAGQFLDTNGVFNVNTTTLASVITIQATSSASTVNLITAASSTGETMFSVSSAGVIQQNSQKSCTLGLTTDASGNINGCVASDLRLKKNILEMAFDPNILNEITPVNYVFKSTPSTLRTGFIAQDVQKAFPRAVVPAGQGLLGVDPNAMIAYLWKYMQTLSKQFTDFMHSTVTRMNSQDEKIKEQQAQLDKQQHTIDYLLIQVNDLKKGK